ncbi:putative peptide chain release factor 1 [Waddlia chondrophila 2032/99]|uniref:Putative peptide chain release factor 1 n=2 Tax=Waddlia chondrophila TaxID=71667 RepID=D6YRW5_WADCW|nr:peptide chain release factor-like protein [Waddlia chondrophila]ADI38810.1 putative peptide chain release factor 1 [Waddlia chondrophila WSU 86-1044]CCB90997.1 putative peptide chain release factor 1 [Waddlia chondrophila 2032/99]
MHIRPEKINELQRRMESLGIRNEDLTEKFILGSGKGGQKVNKTASCVYLKHEPSGIEIKCQLERSRELNRFYARRLLCEKIEEKILKIKTEKQKEIEKIKRQKKRRSRRQQQKILEEKRHQSEKKKLRQKPESEYTDHY